jgi:UDP-2-acetamido-3-amino-2,3-dideoxy-glucuronate N-acetyltransferase
MEKDNKMDFFAHHLADCLSEKIGEGTHIWQFTVVLEKAQIGRNCNVNCHCFIENDVVIGDNVTVKSGVYLWDGVTLENDVFVGPNATFTNDKTPRSKQQFELLRTVVCQGASIGAGAVLLPGLRIGRHAIIGAGAVVAHDVPDGGVVYGNSARLRLMGGVGFGQTTRDIGHVD